MSNGGSNGGASGLLLAVATFIVGIGVGVGASGGMDECPATPTPVPSVTTMRTGQQDAPRPGVDVTVSRVRDDVIHVGAYGICEFEDGNRDGSACRWLTSEGQWLLVDSSEYRN